MLAAQQAKLKPGDRVLITFNGRTFETTVVEPSDFHWPDCVNVLDVDEPSGVQAWHIYWTEPVGC